MWPESSEQQQPLRSGLTTGTCATACCVAAAHLLLGETSKAQASVTLPAKKQGQESKIVELDIINLEHADQLAHAATIKDAGDDPDVTHGAKVWVNLGLTPETGIQFSAGPGVGTVTRAGLMLDIGEPAINPVPRQMMQANLQAVRRFDRHDQPGRAGGCGYWSHPRHRIVPLRADATEVVRRV